MLLLLAAGLVFGQGGFLPMAREPWPDRLVCQLHQVFRTRKMKAAPIAIRTDTVADSDAHVGQSDATFPLGADGV